jgi:hypothetical protein
MTEYDAPDLTAVGFLYAIMRDPSVPIRQRVAAASKLLPLTAHEQGPRFVEREPWPGEQRITIIIEGLNPDPQYQPIPAHVQRAYADIAAFEVARLAARPATSASLAAEGEAIYKSQQQIERDRQWIERCRRYGLDPTQYMH